MYVSKLYIVQKKINKVRDTERSLLNRLNTAYFKVKAYRDCLKPAICYRLVKVTR